MSWVVRVRCEPERSEAVGILAGSNASRGVAEVPVVGLDNLVELIIGFDDEDHAGHFSTLLAIDGYRAEIEAVRPGEWAPTGTVAVDTAAGEIMLEVLTAFGNGGHPTTRLALDALDHLDHTEGATMLDVGCGTGILSIAAARAGYTTVGCDVDHEAVAISVRNAARNLVQDSTDFIAASATGLIPGRGPCPPAGFDAVVANVPIGVHEDVAAALDRLAAPDGLILITGILLEQGDRALAAYETWDEVERCHRDGWLQVTLRR